MAYRTKRCGPFPLALFLALVAVLGAPAAAVSEPGAPGGDFLISTADTCQHLPALAYNSDDDEFLVVWDDLGTVAGSDIRGQIFSARGAPQGASFAISSAVEDQSSPAVAYNSYVGQYLVVWQDSRGDTGIYGQLVDPDGTLPGGQDPAVNLAICTASRTQANPAVAYNVAADEYLVVWEDDRSGSGFDIYGQRVDADGTLLGAGDPAVNFAISTAYLGQRHPGVAYNPLPADEYLVVWQDQRNAFDYNIYGQRVDADGTLLDGGDSTVNLPISTAAYNQLYPELAYNPPPADEYLVVWQDGRDGIYDNDIYGQRVDADGTLLGAGDPALNFAVSAADFDESLPDVAYNAVRNQYLVVWRDDRDAAASGEDLYGLRVGSDGTLAAQGDFAISTAIASQRVPAVAYSTTSEQYLVVWEDLRSAGDQPHIYGQRVWWPGLPVGHELTVSGPGTRQTPAVAYDTREHRYLAVWADDAGGDYDLYGQLYHRDGYPIDEVFVIVDLAGDQLNPDVAYNGDDRQYVVVFEGPGGIGGQAVTAQGSLDREPFFVWRAGGLHRPAVAYARNADALDKYYLVVGEDAEGFIWGWWLWPGNLLTDPSGFGFAATEPRRPDVVYNPTDNQFLVVWQDMEGVDWDVYGRRVEAHGSWEGSRIVISAAAQGQVRPRAVYNPDDNQYLVVWEDYRNGSDFDVYAQRIDPADGSLLGGNVAVASSAPAASQAVPVAVYADAMDRYRLVWQDNRDTGTLGWDLRGQWLGADGANPGTLDAPLLRYRGNQLEPDIAYSEGSLYNRALTVWEDQRTGSGEIYGSFDALDDDPPRARFTRAPRIGRVGDTFRFNAWPSRDDVTPRGDLLVRWDLDDDGAWDDPIPSLQKYVTCTLGTAGVHTITLEVWDAALMTDTLSLQVGVLPAARAPAPGKAPLAEPPTATLSVDPAWAAAGTTFQADGSGSSGAGTLEGRFDWEDDGLFDTAWDPDLQASEQYTLAGDYTLRLVVKDDSGLTHAALRNITVVPDAPVQLAISPGVVTMVPGEVLRFRVTGWDQYDNVMYHPEATWSVTDAQAGTMGAGGVFTASRQAGVYSDAIRVESDGVVGTATVTVAWPYSTYLPIVLRRP